MDRQLELVFDAKAALGEGPCWDAEKGLLYWVDILGMELHIYNTSDNTDKTFKIGQFTSAVVLRKSGGAVLALQDGLHFFDMETGKCSLINHPESHIPGNRFNDGKCDAAGRFWVGSMDMECRKPSGCLYCLKPDLEIIKVLEGVTISNGIDWSPDNQTMYYVDSATKQVAAFDFDLDSGLIHKRRVVIEIPEGEGVPDGMTVDSEGMLWVAQWGGYRVSRWNPVTGELLDTVAVPAANVTSCTFGGIGMDELYITTARAGNSDEELIKNPHAGGIFRIKPGVKGKKPNLFAG